MAKKIKSTQGRLPEDKPKRRNKAPDYLKDFDVTDGKNRSPEELEKIREYEDLLGISTINPFGTLDAQVFANKLDDMTTTELKLLAIKVGVPPRDEKLLLKSSLARAFDDFRKRNIHQAASTPDPIVDPNQKGYSEIKKLFNEGF